MVFGKDGITTSYLKLHIHSIKTVLSIADYLISNDYMPVMMICSRDNDSTLVTDYNNDDLMYHFFSLSACVLSLLLCVF